MQIEHADQAGQNTPEHSRFVEIELHQRLENALSTASWHLRHGRVNEATGRILSAARHLKPAYTTATTSGRA